MRVFSMSRKRNWDNAPSKCFFNSLKNGQGAWRDLRQGRRSYPNGIDGLDAIGLFLCLNSVICPKFVHHVVQLGRLRGIRKFNMRSCGSPVTYATGSEAISDLLHQVALFCNRSRGDCTVGDLSSSRFLKR